jgi:hypothetical protein
MNMNFIEQLIGLSPDAGTGTLEFLFILVPVVGIYLVSRLRHRTT